MIDISVLEKCSNYTVTKNSHIFRCGKCENCNATKASEWATRAMHELLTTKKAVFITLTYSNKNITKCDKKLFQKQARGDIGGNLNPEDMKAFIKRLRQKYKDIKLRYIYCGEYGDLKKRPHYHMILYGIEYSEKLAEDIKTTWKLGHTYTEKNKINSKIIKYIMAYTRKKIENKSEKYEKIGRMKPFQRQSQSIGKEWAIKNVANWSTTLTVTTESKTASVPRQYIRIIQKKEGITIRYITYTSKDKQKTEQNTYNLQNKKQYNYKVLKNYNGKYTKKITEVQEQIKQKRRKENQEYYKKLEIHWEEIHKDLDIEEKARKEKNDELLKSYYEIEKETCEKHAKKILEQVLLEEYKNNKKFDNYKKKMYKNSVLDKISNTKTTYAICRRYISPEAVKKINEKAIAKEKEKLKSPYGYRTKINF